jgi:ferrochelatase
MHLPTQDHKTGVLLVNLGTPNSPSPKDVYRYLIEFLTDGRVIDTSWLYRQLLVRGVIVPIRYRQSAKYYKEIWTPEGSPLKVYGYRVRDRLQESLGDNYAVELAMRYQSPSIEDSLKRLMKNSINRLIILPLFPQYASATTGSVHQRVMEIISKWNVIPETVLIDHYADHPGMIRAFCEVAKPYNPADYDHVLLSFHGLPARQLVKADGKGHCLRCKDCCKKSHPQIPAATPPNATQQQMPSHSPLD